MFSPPRKMKVAALLCVVLFTVSLVHLFLLRFEAGNVYPRYSSLRSDPLGTRALYESLNRLSGSFAERNFSPWHQIGLDQGITLMIVGLRDNSFRSQRMIVEQLFDRLKHSGGRLVLTFTSNKGAFKARRDEEAQPSNAKKKSLPTDDDPIEEFVEEEDEQIGDSTTDEDVLDAIRDFGAHIKMSTDDPIDTFAELSFDEPSMLPYAIPWRSPLYFELRNKHHWKTLYTWQDQPVVVQRQLGKGTVVMVADSYLLSNEGLRNHRSTGLLAWLVVPGHNIIFDEFNKGLIKKPGVAGLARQYRLHGVFAALLVIAALFIWRQSAVFIPSVRSEESSSVTKPASGRETSQGMVHLSRRHIGTKELLTVCFNTWKTQAAERTSNSSIAQVEALVKQAASDPRKEKQVETYKKVCELLKQGKRP